MEQLKRTGEYVCFHCHVIYTFVHEELCCDNCGRRLKWVALNKLFELEEEWTREEENWNLTEGRGDVV